MFAVPHFYQDFELSRQGPGPFVSFSMKVTDGGIVFSPSPIFIRNFNAWRRRSCGRADLLDVDVNRSKPVQDAELVKLLRVSCNHSSERMHVYPIGSYNLDYMAEHSDGGGRTSQANIKVTLIRIDSHPLSSGVLCFRA